MKIVGEVCRWNGEDDEKGNQGNAQVFIFDTLKALGLSSRRSLLVTTLTFCSSRMLLGGSF